MIEQFRQANVADLLPDIDPWELYLFIHLPEPIAVWFYRPEFDVVARDWLVNQLDVTPGRGVAATRLQRAALYLRFGLATGGKVLSWEEVAEMLPGKRSKQAARELGTKGLATLWRQYRPGVDRFAKNRDLLPACETVIADLTSAPRDMEDAASLAPPHTPFYNPRYAAGALRCRDCGARKSAHGLPEGEDPFECDVCGGTREHRKVPPITPEQLFPWRRDAE